MAGANYSDKLSFLITGKLFSQTDSTFFMISIHLPNQPISLDSGNGDFRTVAGSDLGDFAEMMGQHFGCAFFIAG